MPIPFVTEDHGNVLESAWEGYYIIGYEQKTHIFHYKQKGGDGMNELTEQQLRRLRQFMNMQEETALGISRNRDKAKGKVRLRWNHRTSTNLSQYRIDTIAARSLTTRIVEPNPVYLTPDELRRKI